MLFRDLFKLAAFGRLRVAASVLLVLLLVLWAWTSTPLLAEPGRWRAGISSVDMTPEGSIWLAGYAARTQSSQGIASPIRAKALALESSGAKPCVVVTTDLLTMPREIADRVARRLEERFGIPRAHVMLTASHSHSAPVIEDRLIGMYKLDEENHARVRRYTAQVEEKIFAAAASALDDLQPAALAFTHSKATFARNRRRVNPDDPVDHDVPMLTVACDPPGSSNDSGESGKSAVLFAYACHNTTLSGLEMCGDYAGFAQADLEKGRPGLTALFVSGCAGDINPDPRRSMDLAKRHGRELADAVLKGLDGEAAPLEALPSALATAFGRVELPLVPAPSRSELESQLESSNLYVRIRARQLLGRLDSGASIPESYPLAVQCWRLGAGSDRRPSGFTIIAIAGEVVVDYALRLKRELGGRRLLVAAYANDCPAYIPSERVLREGGYEGGGAMLYYGFHGPWASGVEERVLGKVYELVDQTGGGVGSCVASSVVASGANLERIWTGGGFTEGPAVTNGSVYFTDIPNQRIVRLDEMTGEAEVFKEQSGRANGLIFDRAGRLLACEGAAPGGGRRVVRYEKDGRVTVLAERIDGQRLNSPNDITIDRRGRIYFSDPRYSGDEPRELERESVYRIDAPGEVREVIRGVVKPNGLAVSPDGETLYVSDTEARKLYAYRIPDGDGGPVRDRVVFDFRPWRAIDGMEVDAAGNIYGAAGRGERSGVYVISPRGELLDFVHTPETATNCAFGGEDRKTLYITAGESLYRLRVVRAGHGME